MNIDINITSKVLGITIEYYNSLTDDVINEYFRELMDLASEVSFRDYPSYYEMTRAYAAGNIPAVSTKPEYVRGCIVDPDEELAGVLLSLDAPKDCLILTIHTDGAISDIPSHQTAFYNRRGILDLFATCQYDGLIEKARVMKFQHEFIDVLEKNAYCSGYNVNEMDRQLSNWREKYYGGNYDCLVAIQAQWNPLSTSSFHFTQEIGSDYEP